MLCTYNIVVYIAMSVQCSVHAILYIVVCVCVQYSVYSVYAV